MADKQDKIDQMLEEQGISPDALSQSEKQELKEDMEP
jgi:hypothetical protein